MCIYHIDWFYNKDEKNYTIYPYNLKGTIKTYLMKNWILDNTYKSKRNIGGLIDFFRLASFSEKRLYKKLYKLERTKGWTVYRRKEDAQ